MMMASLADVAWITDSESSSSEADLPDDDDDDDDDEEIGRASYRERV